MDVGGVAARAGRAERHVAQASGNLDELLGRDLGIGGPGRGLVVAQKGLKRRHVDRLTPDKVDPRFVDDTERWFGFHGEVFYGQRGCSTRPAVRYDARTFRK
jgi:hypothetical protein